ncbi:UNVERIFIED_CONTAM: hypothetical protein RMT77_014432 [Armadillidium vulgare]
MASSSRRMINLLIVGSSEARMFLDGKEHLREVYNVNIQVEFRPGVVLDECLAQIKKKMKPNTHVIIIWALTPYGWKREYIRAKGKREISVFRPALHVSLDPIPRLMNHIMRYVYSVNSSCEVYLSIPAVKDMYKFNQNRLIKNWGIEYKNCLENNHKLGMEPMQHHSIQMYHMFQYLWRNEYHWEDKKLIYGNGAFNLYTKHLAHRSTQPLAFVPHKAFLRKEHPSLDSDLLPDGLHGNQKFLKYYMMDNKKIFLNYWTTNEPTSTPPPTHTKKQQGKESLLGDDPGEPYQHLRTITPTNNNQNEISPTPEHVSKILNRFVDVSQPSTSRDGLVEAHNPSVTRQEWRNSSYTPYTHTAYVPHIMHVPNSFPNPAVFPSCSSYEYSRSHATPHDMRLDPERDADAHSLIREFLEDRRKRGQGEKRKQMEDLNSIIRVALYELEVVKKRKK